MGHVELSICAAFMDNPEQQNAGNEIIFSVDSINDAKIISAQLREYDDNTSITARSAGLLQMHLLRSAWSG
jgi:ActR/RegA family two-component response regulator